MMRVGAGVGLNRSIYVGGKFRKEQDLGMFKN